ncbi:CPVL [Symbiodinium natans]|uniref:CPVL protein n=1 Tax=Symbiodinium natans TaxID=878477 RepID=A0A812JLK9_9DINO|nr:CPVL [Symbiodinium natans]
MSRALLAWALLAQAVAVDDEVKSLPGVGVLKNKHYAGFAVVNQTTDRTSQKRYPGSAAVPGQDLARHSHCRRCRDGVPHKQELPDKTTPMCLARLATPSSLEYSILLQMVVARRAAGLAGHHLNLERGSNAIDGWVQVLQSPASPGAPRKLLDAFMGPYARGI